MFFGYNWKIPPHTWENHMQCLKSHITGKQPHMRGETKCNVLKLLKAWKPLIVSWENIFTAKGAYRQAETSLRVCGKPGGSCIRAFYSWNTTHALVKLTPAKQTPNKKGNTTHTLGKPINYKLHWFFNKNIQIYVRKTGNLSCLLIAGILHIRRENWKYAFLYKSSFRYTTHT